MNSSADVPPGTNECLTVPTGSVVMEKLEGFPKESHLIVENIVTIFYL